MKTKILLTIVMIVVWMVFVKTIFGQDSSRFEPHLKLTNTGKRFPNKLFKLKLEYFKDGQSEGYIYVNSGSPENQVFNTGEESRRGSLEPLPEGVWYIDNIKWAKGKDNYKGNWGKGLGSVKIPLMFRGITGRGSILIHLDSNASYSPGTAGCIGVLTVADFKRLVTWLRDTDPRALYVDWGLGSVDYDTTTGRKRIFRRGGNDTEKRGKCICRFCRSTRRLRLR